MLAADSVLPPRLWREALSPNRALGPLVRRHLDLGQIPGECWKAGFACCSPCFATGCTAANLTIAPLGGGLFGPDTMPLLDRLVWGDRAVAILLDRLIWVTTSRGERTRVHFGTLDVEDLGSIYEGLLDQEPGIANEPMLRQRREGGDSRQAPDIQPGQFYLRGGKGRKASGSFYTPHEFVGFLVRETLDPKIALLSPPTDPHPARLLTHEDCRSCDRQRAFPGRGLPLPGRGTVDRVPCATNEGCAIESLHCPMPTSPSRLSAQSRLPRTTCTRDLSAAGGGALPLRLRPEQIGGGTGEAVTLAGVAMPRGCR